MTSATICDTCLAVRGSVGCCVFERRPAEPSARAVHSFDNAVLEVELAEARFNGTLVNAWLLSDGREVLATRGRIAVALAGGSVQRAAWPVGLSARIVVVGLLTEPASTMGGLL